MHVERLGTSKVEDILFGECYVFPKIDGTNGSVWLDDGVIKAGSRNRELTLENDNQGFYNMVIADENLERFLKAHPNLRLFGEYLVPHTLKSYRDSAWRKFYVFDVMDENDKYLHYNDYSKLLDEYEIEYIPPMRIVKNPKEEYLSEYLARQNYYLIDEGDGVGEGVVVKNYDFVNKFGDQVWAKIVLNEFKEKHWKEMPSVISGKEMVEEKILDKFCTEAFIRKEYAKIVNEKNGWESEYIPMLFGKVWHEFIHEEIWNILKDMKNPTIDFKVLNKLLILKVKQVMKELF